MKWATIPEVGEWTPRHRDIVRLPENLGREVTRLVWWLQDIGCIRWPFIGHPDCFDVPDMPQSSMCARCRALRPYHEDEVNQPVPPDRKGSQ